MHATEMDNHHLVKLLAMSRRSAPPFPPVTVLWQMRDVQFHTFQTRSLFPQVTVLWLMRRVLFQYLKRNVVTPSPRMMGRRGPSWIKAISAEQT